MVCLQSQLPCLLKQQFTLSPASSDYLKYQILIPSWDQLCGNEEFSSHSVRLLSNAWAGSPSRWENWLKCFLTLDRKLRRIVNLKDDVLYGYKHRIITFQQSQTWVNWCFDWARNDVPQNQKLWLYDEAGNYNSNSNSEQLSIKPCRFPLFEHYFSTSRQFLPFPIIRNNPYHLPW